ncbi:hypothetical protein Pan44_45170 [Caulifigura coniformis]|uniref:DUF1990 domain-containing protein n=1 Tax=Caulifigura coniformis TaxID=2527983 RepID=A0A517SK09_9PLAN|nr:DUF1990 domain-containing protein [Caulifigura coniformis]QDT56463.1 hypothetical protein Pan44_45170 [Caulifigura coniformis]
MITPLKPTPALIHDFLARQRELPFTYQAVGSTRTSPPEGHDVDHTRVSLGKGEAAFEAGRLALQQWKQFDLDWVTAGPTDTPVEVGQPIAVWARKFGLYWVNACRIVYVQAEEGPLTRFGFAYGTLPGHVEAGEERFLVEWNRQTDEVFYDILAFSRPRHPLIRLAYPLMRRQQRRFARDSAAAMQAVVTGGRAE